MSSNFQVKDIMTSEVVSIRPEATIDEAISLIVDHHISGLPVVDEAGRLLGVISEIDIIDLVYEADIESSKVGKHMTRSVKSLEYDASLDEAASLFCSHAIRRVPVVKRGRLVGILSRRDLIRFVREVRRQSVVK